MTVSKAVMAVGARAAAPCRAMPRWLLALQRDALHCPQCRFTGDCGSTTFWHRAHSNGVTLSHSRERDGRRSEISLVVSPRERSKGVGKYNIQSGRPEG